MLNKKGIVPVLTVYLWANAALIASGIALTPSFRERKALQYCEAEGLDANSCNAMIAGMSKSEILDYIRDTAERPRP